jgi:hypothetical protein
MKSHTNDTHRHYAIWFDLYEIAGFSFKQPLKARLEIGKHYLETQFIKWEKHRWILDTPSGYFKDWVLKLPSDPDDFPDVVLKLFIYDQREIERCIGIHELDTESLLEQGSTPKDPTWHIFTNQINKNDESLKSHLTGAALFSLNITAVGKFEYFRPNRRHIRYAPYEIRFMISQAQGIQISDIGSLSDPFVVVSINGVSKMTTIIKETLNPQWNQMLRWRMDLPEDLSTCTSIVMDLWDLDEFPSPNELLGSTQIPYNVIQLTSRDDERFPAGKWLRLNAPENRLAPRVLYSAIIFKLNSVKHEIPKSPVPDWLKPLDCNLKVLIISTRQIVGEGFNGVQKPFVLLEAGKEASFSTKLGKRIDLDHGSNHDYLELTSIPIKVFKDAKYAPCIIVKVFDQRPFRNSLLGFAIIDLARYYTWNRQIIIYNYEETKHHEQIFAKLLTHASNHAQITQFTNGPDSPGSPSSFYLSPSHRKRSKSLRFDSDAYKSKLTKVNLYTPDIIHEEAENLFDMTIATTDRNRKVLEADPYPNYTPQGIDRPALDCPFEDTLKESLPFDTFELIRQNNDGENIHAGYVRLAIKLIPSFEEEEDSSHERLLQEVKSSAELQARFYILRVRNLAINETTDNSIFIWMKTKEDNYTYKFDNQTYPADNDVFIMNTYILHIKLPDECKVNIAIWAKENNLQEDFIGQTDIDIESRWFSKEYRNILKENVKLIPQETRALYDEYYIEERGKIVMWVEIFTEEDAINYPQEILSAANTCDYELRVVVWKISELELDEKSDLAISAVINHPEEGKIQKMTDTHYEAKHSAVFNWRLLLPIQYPCPDSTLYLNLLKKSGNTYIPLGTGKVNMQPFYQSVHRFLNKQSLPKAQINICKDSTNTIIGKLAIEVSMLLLEDAQEEAVGEGRSAPNRDPPLSAPESGRGFKELKVEISEIGETLVRRERHYKYWIALAVCLVLCIVIPIVLATYLT